MPRVPRRDSTLLSAQPMPDVRLSTGAPSSAFGGLPSAPDLSGVQRHVTAIVQEEQRRADQIAVLEADNALAEAETSLLYNPKDGHLTRKGKNAFTSPEEIGAAWEQRTSEVEQSLTTERQQIAFRERAANRWQSIHSTVQRHVAGEIQQYDNETANSALANRLDAAIRSNGEPHAVETAVVETTAIVADYGKRNGWSPEVLAEKQATAVSRIHAGVIEQMLSLGNDLDASAYFEDNKPAIAAAQLPAIEKALDQASTDGAGMRAADAIWKAMGPKGPNAPVKIASMEQALRDQLSGATQQTGIVDRIENGIAVVEIEDDKGELSFIEIPVAKLTGAKEGATVKIGEATGGEPASPKVIRAAIAELRSRATAFNAEQAETTAANKAALLGAFNEGAGLGAIKARPEYRALSGSEQESLSSYIEGRQQQRSARADDELTRKQFRAYWELSGAKALHQMTENTILALEPTLGRTLVGQLMQQKRALGTRDAAAEARVLAATIDDDLFKTVAADAGLNPYGTALSEDEKETLGRLKVGVENEIARIQEKANRPITQSEKREVMQKIVDTKVMHDTWGTDETQIAATVRRGSDGRLPSDLYVAIAAVPGDYKTAALNWLRSVGAIKDGTDDAKALTQLSGRIGKAYAARLAGGTTLEIQEILRGQR